MLLVLPKPCMLLPVISCPIQDDIYCSRCLYLQSMSSWSRTFVRLKPSDHLVICSWVPACLSLRSENCSFCKSSASALLAWLATTPA